MKEFKIKYNQLLFLYAYFRHIDLSLDRSRWTSWDQLKDYYTNRLKPASVIEYLNRSFDLEKTDLNKLVFSLEKKSLLKRLRLTVAQNLLFKQKEILYCCKLLWDFERELHSDTKEYNLKIEKLRINIAEFYSEFLELMISKKDLEELMKIEHYLQNNKIEVSNLDEFIPNDF